jgi:hypothetical protein
MKKEEQIKQLKTQLAELQPLMELAKKLPKSHLSNFVSNELATEIKELKGMLEQLEKDSKETKKDFSDIVITGYLDSLGEIRELDQSTTIEELSKEYHSVQFLGYNTSAEKVSVCCTSSSITRHGMPMIRLFFGEEVEKPLKHPHMKDIVATFCISAGDKFEVKKTTEMDKIDWEEWDKVQIIGEDHQYGIVVKATFNDGCLNQFSLFFCEKK